MQNLYSHVRVNPTLTQDLNNIREQLGHGISTDTVGQKYAKTTEMGIAGDLRITNMHAAAANELDKQNIQLLDGIKKSNELLDKTLKNDIAKAVQEAYESNSDDLAGFRDECQNIVQRVQDNTGYSQNYTKNLVDGLSAKYLPIVQKQWATKQNVRVANNAQMEIQNLTRDLEVFMPALMSQDKEDRAIGMDRYLSTVGKIHEVTQRSGFDGKPLFDKAGKANVSKLIGESAARAYCICKYNELGSIAEKSDFIINLQKGNIVGELESNGRVIVADTGAIPSSSRKRLANDLTNNFLQECMVTRANNCHEYVSSVLSGESPVIPNNPDAQAAFDTYYSYLQQGQMSDIVNAVNRSPLEKAGDLVILNTNFVSKTGYVPKEMLSTLRSSIRGNNDITFLTAAQSISAFDNAKISDDSSWREIAYCMFAQNKLTHGDSLEETKAAVQKLIENESSAMPLQRVAQLESVMAERSDKFNTLTLVKELFPDYEYSPNDGEISTKFATEYKNAVKRFYSYTGDVGAAERCAKVYMKQHWVLSEVNKLFDGRGVLSEYAPERFYGTNTLSSEGMYIRAKEHLISNCQQDYTQGFYIVNDEQTIKEIEEGSDSPTYALFIRAGGEFVPAFGRNNEQLRVGANIWRTEVDDQLNGIYGYKQADKEVRERVKLFNLKRKKESMAESIRLLGGQ